LKFSISDIMPRKNKRHKFKCVAKQFMATKEKPPVSSVEDCSTSSKILPEFKPVSQRKLQSNNALATFDEDCSLENATQRSVGYKRLQEAMSNLHMCKDGK